MRTFVHVKTDARYESRISQALRLLKPVSMNYPPNGGIAEVRFSYVTPGNGLQLETFLEVGAPFFGVVYFCHENGDRKETWRFAGDGVDAKLFPAAFDGTAIVRYDARWRPLASELREVEEMRRIERRAVLLMDEIAEEG